MSDEKDKQDPWPWDKDWTPKLEKLIYRLIARKTSASAGADGDVPTANDSEPTAMLKDHAYLTQTSGFVDAIINSTSNAVQGFVGTTNDPAGAGTNVQHQRSNAAASDSCIHFFVGNGKYFEIVAAGDTPTIYWTPLVAGGGAPIDQD